MRLTKIHTINIKDTMTFMLLTKFPKVKHGSAYMQIQDKFGIEVANFNSKT